MGHDILRFDALGPDILRIGLLRSGIKNKRGR